MKRAVALTVALAAVWAPSASAASRVVRFSVRPGQLVQWGSERAYANRHLEDIAIDRVRVDGHRIEGLFEYTSTCRVDMFGHGVVVRVSACRKPRSRLHLRIASANNRTVHVAVRYTAKS